MLIQPQPGGGLTKASASLRSMYGEIVSSWSIDGGTFALDVTVPANTHATIRLPHARPENVKEGGQPVGQVAGVRSVRADGDSVVIEELRTKPSTISPYLPMAASIMQIPVDGLLLFRPQD